MVALLPASLLPKSFKQLTGVAEETPRPQDTASSAIDMPVLTNYTQNEQRRLYKKVYTTDNDRSGIGNLDNAQGIISYILPVHKRINRILTDARQMQMLAPEINQAKLIRTSTIMSPNSLQEGVFRVNLENIPAIPEQGLNKICTILENYFNDTLKLGKLTTDWLGECFYGSGAVPIFIFPTGQLEEFRNDGLQPGLTDYQEKHHQRFDELFKTPVFSDDSQRVRIGVEAFLTNGNSRLDFYQEVLKDTPIFTGTGLAKDIPVDVTKAIEQVTVNLTKKIEEGDIIRISENPEIIKFSADSQKLLKQHVSKKLDTYLNNQQLLYYKTQEFVDISNYTHTDKENVGHPLFKVLPTESVIPIYVPGDPTTHLGYFIIIDEYGNPLKAPDPDTNILNTEDSNSPLIRSTYRAMFGGASSIINDAMGGNDDQVLSRIYNRLLDRFLKKHLERMGLVNVDVNKANAIMATMFHRLLYNKQTKLVYVPTDLLKYFCFDYREDGTGKSTLENVSFVLSLRTIIDVAISMGVARDAVHHRTLNVTMDSKETDPEGVMELIGQTFIDKERIRYSLDPTDITKSIARSALSIVPRGLKGCQFEVERTNDGSGGRTPDVADLRNTFTNMFISGLCVPPAAMNNLGDNEYARSIVTTNLFFAKQTKNDQRTTCENDEDIVKTYIRHSPKLKTAILEVIKSYIKDNKQPEINSTGQHRPSGTLIESEDTASLKQRVLTDHLELLAVVIDNIRLSLPTPNIAPDKAQYDEYNSYSGMIDTLVDKLWSADLVPMDDQQSTEALKILRATLKKDLLFNYMKDLGPVDSLQLPDIKDISALPYEEQYQTILNLARGIFRTKKIFTPEETSPDFGGDGDLGLDDSGMGDDLGSMDGGSELEEPDLGSNPDTKEPQPMDTSDTTDTSTEPPTNPDSDDTAGM